MVINHNMSSLFATRQEGINAANVQNSMAKLSSGEKINRAGDDASGLAVSEKMRAQIRGLKKASDNVENGVSFIQTTEGYLQETTDILQRVRELSVQSANGIYTDEDRMQIQVEVSSLVSEVSRIASQAQFNGMNMLTGRFATEGIKFHIGANADQNVAVTIGDVSAKALGLVGSQSETGAESIISVASSDEANRTIGVIDNALNTVNKQRADLGAAQNKFEMAQKGIDVAAENLISSESRIRDTDIAEEYTNFVKNQILHQASNAMISQATYMNRDAVRSILS